MIFDYLLKREALRRLIVQARHAHAHAAIGDPKEAAANWLDVLTGIDEDLIRAHDYRSIAIEHEAVPMPMPKNKGGRPKTRNPITAGALN